MTIPNLICAIDRNRTYVLTLRTYIVFTQNPKMPCSTNWATTAIKNSVQYPSEMLCRSRSLSYCVLRSYGQYKKHPIIHKSLESLQYLNQGLGRNHLLSSTYLDIAVYYQAEFSTSDWIRTSDLGEDLRYLTMIKENWTLSLPSSMLYQLSYGSIKNFVPFPVGLPMAESHGKPAF